MLKRLFGRSDSIAGASLVVFAVTVVSKIIAYLESAVAASYFGTTSEVDMFYLANSISYRFIFTIFAGISIVGVTMYGNALKQGGREQADRFVSALLAFVIPASAVVTALLFLTAPAIAKLMASNYTQQEQAVLCQYIRILCFVAAFYAVCTVLTAVLNANKRFVPGCLCTVLQNLTLIAFIVFLSEQIGIRAIVTGFLVGYVVQAVFLYFCSCRLIKLTRCSIKEDLDIRKLILLLFPLMLGDASGEINLLIDQFLSSELGEGSISALSYSGMLDDFVSSFFIQTITSVLLPFFSVLVAEKRFEELSGEVKKVFYVMSLILAPITVITIGNASTIVSIVYERGAFDKNSVAMTAAALTGYGIGFLCKAVLVIAKRPFYAMENTRVPMYLGFFTVTVNIALSVILSRVMGIFGITAATSISFLLGDLLIFYLMRRMIPGTDWSGILVFLLKIVVSGTVSGVGMAAVNRSFALQGMPGFVVNTIICFAVYIAVLWLLRTEELAALIDNVAERLRKSKRPDDTGRHL